MELRFSTEIKRLFMMLSGIILPIISLTVFQDFLESKREGYNFHFSESLLFKTGWLLYIPILIILYKKLNNKTINTRKTITYIISFVAIHIFLLSLIASGLALIFFQGNYDVFKFLSYTVTHDLYILTLIYTAFVLGYRYFYQRKLMAIDAKVQTKTENLIINNGKENTIIPVNDILQITSATPYVSIHLENKKHLHSETLKSIHEKLDQNIFIRIHKSTLVNITKVASFKSRLNGDYDLLLTDNTIVRLSRTYTADFKKYFEMKSSG